MARRTYTVTREECAVTEKLQALQVAENQRVGLARAMESVGDQLSDAAKAETMRVLAELEAKVQTATREHSEAIAAWNAAGSPTYRGRGVAMRWNRA